MNNQKNKKQAKAEMDQSEVKIVATLEDGVKVVVKAVDVDSHGCK